MNRSMRRLIIALVGLGAIWFAISMTFTIFIGLFHLSDKNTIRNYSSLDSSKLKESLTLLPEPYQTLDVKIEIYEGKKQFMQRNIFRYNILLSKEEKEKYVSFMDTTKGFYDPRKNKIYLFLDKFPQVKESMKPTELLVTASLYHEMRHAYQWKYEKELNQLEYIDPNKEGYTSQPVEEDAEAFAEKAMTSFHEKLSVIYDVDFLWYYQKGSHLMVDLGE